jgi:hypothetical protein
MRNLPTIAGLKMDGKIDTFYSRINYVLWIEQHLIIIVQIFIIMHVVVNSKLMQFNHLILNEQILGNIINQKRDVEIERLLNSPNSRISSQIWK